MFIFQLIKNKLAVALITAVFLIVAIIICAIAWLDNYYRPTEFIYNFSTNIIATTIGIVIGALVAVLVTIAIINPYIKFKDEKRLAPLRHPILLFWDHTLTSYTISVLQSVDCPSVTARVLSDVGMELAQKMDNLADENRLLEIKNWLKDITTGEELRVRSVESFQTALDELKDFIERMHTTLVALPTIFKEIPEVAVGVEVLLGNLLGGVKMIEYKHEVENKLNVTKLDFYSSAIIKNTANDALSLVGEIRNAHSKH